MATLTTCIKKAGDALSGDDKAAVLSAFTAAKAGGASTADAARQAVEQQLEVVQGLLDAAQAEFAAPKTAPRATTLTAESGDSEAIRQAKADAMKALGDLGDILSRGTRLNMLPEQEQKLVPVLTRLMDAAFRLGYLKFKDAARWAREQVRAALGDDIANELTLQHWQGAYIGMSGRYADQGVEGIMDVAKVTTLDQLNDTETADAPMPAPDLAGDRQNAEDQSAPVEAGNGGGQPAAATRQGGGGSRGSRGRRADDPGVPAGGTTAGRESGDQPVRGEDGTTGPQELPSGTDESERGADPRGPGVQSDPVADEAVEDATADLPDNLKRKRAQREAESIAVTVGDLDNIRATLPYLMPEQQEDVLKAEQQHAKPDGYGMLFTNGTGTGKTFTGLGVIKRLQRQGKGNQLIVVPDAKIMADWVDSAKSLGLTITPLESTKDTGKGIVITTYANLDQNNELVSRDWDHVLADEAHQLMQGKDGEATGALDNLRAMTWHPRGVYERYSRANADDIARAASLSKQITQLSRLRNLDDTMDAMRADLARDIERLEAQLKPLTAKLTAARKAIEEKAKTMTGAARPRATFLSATPFAYDKTVDWAEGYLFDYGAEPESRGYNTPSAQQQFFMTHFGYRMKNGKLNKPDAKVDSGLMQRQFNGWLKKSGALSGRTLAVKPDYDRRFVLLDSAVGNQIDSALKWIGDQATAEREANRDKSDPDSLNNTGFSTLSANISDKLYGSDGHLVRRYLLEAIKAKEVVPIIRQHLALGRKVVVFHDFNKGGSNNPFLLFPQPMIDIAPDAKPADRELQENINRQRASYNAALQQFDAKFAGLTSGTMLSELVSPIERFSKEFPNVLLINGTEKKSDVLRRYKEFNDDANGPAVALVQSAKNKGWSGHDTTGKHQRVLINLGLPTQPTMTIQQEGRIYRLGVQTNAIFRYLNTGTNWERWAFAQTIARRSSEAENLGQGEQARALMDAFVSAFEESDTFEPGHEGEGTGGKDRDALSNAAITEYDRAKSFYWGTAKKNSKTKAQEGTDYFATPEPVGLKLVQWLQLYGGEDAAEPSAGHGAIARWFPDNVSRTAIEPSMVLRSKLALAFDGKIIEGNFEDLHVVNKFDGFAMNPPFGTAGRTAIDHLAKAATHLRDGGRIAAIIPTGPAADKKFDAWFYEKSQRPVKPLGSIMLDGTNTPIYKGDTIESRASWAPTGVVVGWRDGNPVVRATAPEFRNAGDSMVSAQSVKSVQQTGKRTEEFSPAEGLHLVADIKLPSVTFERAGTGVMTRIVVIEKSPNAAPTKTVDLTNITDINELFDRLEDMTVPTRAKQDPAAVGASGRAGAMGGGAAAVDAAWSMQRAERLQSAVAELNTARDAARGQAKTHLDGAITALEKQDDVGAALELVQRAMRVTGDAQFLNAALAAVDALRSHDAVGQAGIRGQRGADKAQREQVRAEAVKKAEEQGIKLVEHTTGSGNLLKGVIRKDLTRDQALGIDKYSFKKDGGWFIRAEHLAKLAEKFPPAANEPAPAYGTQTQTPEFKAWFGDSKVVDADGKPLVVYHGKINGDLEGGAFEAGQQAKARRTMAPNGAFFFAGSPGVASGYAAPTAPSKGGAVFPVYLSLQNPLIIQAVGYRPSFAQLPIPADLVDAIPIQRRTDIQGTLASTNEIADAAMASGRYDGMIVRNVVDAMSRRGGSVKPTDVYVAFKPEQIKSAISNDGSFDANDPSIVSERAATYAAGRIRRSVDELVQAAQDQASWKDWYEMHQAAVENTFGADAKLFQRILSATSQMQTVKGNVTMALRAYERMFSGEPFTGFLPAVAKNLERIRNDEDLTGPKISQFERGNLGDDEAMAIDRHIAQLLFNTSTPNRKQIESAKARIRKVAERLGWTPKQTQSALWAANMVRKGTPPDKVVSYDKVLEQRADAIRAIRERLGRDGRGGSADAGRAAAEGTAGRPEGESGGLSAAAPRRQYQDDRQQDLFSQQIDLFLGSKPDESQAGPGIEAARSGAADALRSMRGPQSTVLGRHLASGLAENQRTNLVGQVARTPEDLATLAQVYRDPRFETFRVVFTGAGNRIIAQVGLTNRMPGSAYALIGNDLRPYLDELFGKAKAAGATGFYMLHNHPSGNPTPSSADVFLTQEYEKFSRNRLDFHGHVVIDTNEYSVIDAYGEAKTLKKDFGAVAPYTDAGEWGNFEINSPAKAMEMAKRLQVDDGAVTLIIVDSQHKTKHITTIPAETVKGTRVRMIGAIRRATLQATGSKIIAVTRDPQAAAKIARHSLDVIQINRDGSLTSFANAGAAGGGSTIIPERRSTRVTADTSPVFDYLRPLAMQEEQIRRERMGAPTPRRGVAQPAYQSQQLLGDAISALGSEYPSADKNESDRLIRDAHLLSYLNERGTLDEQGLGSFDVPGKRVVLDAMGAVLQNLKVRRSVVELVPVDVVNVLAGKQLPAKELFDDVPMLLDLLAVNGDKAVAAGTDRSGTAIGHIARAIAESAGLVPGFDGSKSVSAVLASVGVHGANYNRVFSGDDVAITNQVYERDAQYRIDGAADAAAQPPGRPPRPPKQRSLGLKQDPSWTADKNTGLDAWLYKYQDKFVDLKRAQEAIASRGREISDRFDAYLQEELYHGRAASRVERFAEEELRPLLAEMKAREVTQARLSQYLHARHAKEANELIAERDPDTPDGGSGMMTADAKSFLEGLDAGERKRLEAVASKVDTIIAKTRDLTASYGLEGKAVIDGWAAMFKHYVPLQRDMGDAEGGMGTGQGFQIRGKEAKSRTGSTDLDVSDILANVAAARERIIVRGEKNRVGVALAGLVKTNPNPDVWSFESAPTERYLNEATNTVEVREVPGWRQRDNVLMVKIADGKGGVQERAIVFNDQTERGRRMIAALKNLDAAQLEGWVAATAKVTRFLASVNTQYNPIFGIVNLARDVQGAAINLVSTPLNGKQAQVMNETRKFFGQALATGFRMDAIKDPETAALWREFQLEGGTTAFREMFRTTEDRADAIKRELDPQYWMKEGMFKFVGNTPGLAQTATFAQKAGGGLFNWLSDYNEAMENVVRMAAYKVAKEQGMSRQRAASLAKNLTVNFNRKGTMTTFTGALYAFFNAAMQGTARMAQVMFTMQGGDIKTLRLTRAGQAIIGGGVMLGALQALALAAAGFDDDEPPDFVRERNLIIPVGGGKYILIPMPLGWHVLPNIGRIATETAMKGGKDSGKAALKMATVLAEAFNPLGGSGPFLQIMAPTVADPVVAILTNRDWRNKPITSESFNKKDQPGFLNYKDTATGFAKVIAEAANTMTGGTSYERGLWSPTPDQIQYLIGQVTGGAGREITKGVEVAENAKSGEETPWHKIPLAGRFFGDTKDGNVQSTRFYAALEAARQDEASLKLMKASGDRVAIDRFLANNPEAGTLPAAERTASALKRLRDQKRSLVESNAQPSRIREIEAKMHDASLAFNTQIKAVRDYGDQLRPLYLERAALHEQKAEAGQIAAVTARIDALIAKRSAIMEERAQAVKPQMKSVRAEPVN